MYKILGTKTVINVNLSCRTPHKFVNFFISQCLSIKLDRNYFDRQSYFVVSKYETQKIYKILMKNRKKPKKIMVPAITAYSKTRKLWKRKTIKISNLTKDGDI